MPFPVDGRWIKTSEEKLGVRFPASFVSAMATVNGGSVNTEFGDFNLFPFFDGSDRKRIQRICRRIARETESPRMDWLGVPSDAVAIGENRCGDLLVLVPMADSADTLQHTVHWWDHETVAVEAIADDVSELAKS